MDTARDLFSKSENPAIDFVFPSSLNCQTTNLPYQDYPSHNYFTKASLATVADLL